MAILYPDNIRTNNPDEPLILAEDTTIQGWSHVSDNAARNALPDAMRIEGAVVVVGDIPYVYKSTDFSNGAWSTAGNWEEVGGGTETLDGLTDVGISSPQPNQVLMWDNSGSVWRNETLAYSDVAGTPVLGLVATTNLYSDLDSLPVLGLVAETNLYGDLDEKPTFVASTGMTINTSTNGAGGTEYEFISTATGGGDATVAGGLGQFPDTDIATPLTGQVLVYDTNDGAWNNVSRSFANDITVNPLPAVGGGALAYDGTSILSFAPADLSPYLTSVSLADLTDVDPAGATNGQILEYDGADWVAADAPASDVTSVNTQTGAVSLSLGNLTDVDTGGASAGSILEYDGADWVVGSIPGGGDALTSNGIDQFSDVGYAGSPSAGQTLEWVGATWRNVDSSKLSTLQINTAVASGGGSLSFNGTNELTFTPASVPTNLGDLSDVDTGGASSGDILEYDGSDWVVATPSGGGGDATVAGGLSQFADTAISSPSNGQVLQYNNATSDWENINLPFASIDTTGSSITDLPGISAGIVSPGALNSILVGFGTDYIPGYAADEHASMTFSGDPDDGDYYMVLAMPCAAVIQSVTAKTVGSGAVINYQVKKGTLGGTETAVHAVTGATNTKANVASITSSALAEGDELWVALDTSANMGQFTITVNYRPSPRFTT